MDNKEACALSERGQAYLKNALAVPMSGVDTDLELKHWGIKGMKWGQRRYQNKDGSLTPAGKKRYNTELAELRKEKKDLKKKEEAKARDARLDKLRKEVDDKKKELSSEETVEQKKERVLKSRSAAELYKNAHLFSDAELSTAYNRLNMERNIKSLIPEQVDKGKQAVDKVTGWTKSIVSLTTAGIGLYNNVAKVYNSVDSLNNGNKIPVIKDNDKKDADKKAKKDKKDD